MRTPGQRGRGELRRSSQLVVLLLMGTMLVRFPAAHASTLNVCPGCQYTTIQAAINAANAHDTVQILSTYDSLSAGENFPVTLTTASYVAITGEVDSNGNPTTTVDISHSTKTPPHDGFIVVTDGVTVSNLKIIDSSSATGDIQRAIASGTLAQGRSHGLGLTIRNVAIDLRGTNGFHGGNGLDLITDNVLIDHDTVMGVTGSAISVDGYNFTMSNNQLNGMDASHTVRASYGIALGNDLPSTQACSGIPHDYTITKNTITGFVDGIEFCNGQNNKITNNILSDISGKAIETSGTQTTTISGNTITWNYVAGIHGIGFSSNIYQSCASDIISDNQILGRSANDVQQGIAVQDCTNMQILRNTMKNLGTGGNNALFYSWTSASAGTTTASVIDGNVVQYVNSNGIAYLGSDSGSTNVDSTIVRNNVVENIQENGIIVEYVKGTGGAITRNQVRSSNLGGSSNGFNLQFLRGTLIDGNQAFATAGTGYGFFLANSQSLTGGCNLGSGNGGGLLFQTGVNPAFTNAGTDCTAQPVLPVPLSTLSSHLLNAPANSVYFIFPDSNTAHKKPTGVGYASVTDWTALGFVYGSLTYMPQTIALDTDSSVIDQSTGAPKVSNKTIVLFGGPLVNEAVHYYEANGIAPLHWGLVGGWTSGTEYYYNQTGQAVASLPILAILSNQDMGLIEAFMDQNGNTVIIFSGFGWKGTFFSGVYFRTVLMSQLSTMTDSWYIYSWTDSNSNGFPEVTEVNPTPVNHGN